MQQSSASPNFAGVANLKKTSMASSRDYLAYKQKVRKDSPLRRARSELSLSFKRDPLCRKDYRRRIKVNNVLESRPDVPEVFRIAPHTDEEPAEGRARVSSRTDVKGEEKERKEEKIDWKGERQSSTESDHLRAEIGSSRVTTEDQQRRSRRCSLRQNKEEHFLPDTVLLRENQKHKSPPHTPLWQTPWFTEELSDLPDELRRRSDEETHEHEADSASSMKRESEAISSVPEKCVQGTEKQSACKMKFAENLGAVHSKIDAPEPVFKGMVWNTLRADAKKVFSDFSSRLLRPPSSDVMHMRPLIREDQDTIHFAKSDQETARPLKAITTRTASTVVPSDNPETLPMSKYFDHSHSAQKAATPPATPAESSSITTKSVSRQKQASSPPHVAGGSGHPTACLPGPRWLPSSSPACSRHLLGVLRSITRTGKGQN